MGELRQRDEVFEFGSGPIIGERHRLAHVVAPSSNQPANGAADPPGGHPRRLFGRVIAFEFQGNRWMLEVRVSHMNDEERIAGRTAGATVCDRRNICVCYGARPADVGEEYLDVELEGVSFFLKGKDDLQVWVVLPAAVKAGDAHRWRERRDRDAPPEFGHNVQCLCSAPRPVCRSTNRGEWISIQCACDNFLKALSIFELCIHKGFTRPSYLLLVNCRPDDPENPYWKDPNAGGSLSHSKAHTCKL